MGKIVIILLFYIGGTFTPLLCADSVVRSDPLKGKSTLDADIARKRIAFYFDKALYVTNIGYRLLESADGDVAKLPFLYADVTSEIERAFPEYPARSVVAIGKLASFAGESLRLERGDQIIGINGTAVRSENDINDVLKRSADTRTATVAFARGDDEWTATVPLIRLERDIAFYIDTHSSDVNAYTNTRSFIAVTTQMLRFMETEEELAFILAHELGHIARDHWLQGGIKRTAGMEAGATLGGWVQEQVPEVPGLGYAAGTVAYHIVTAPLGRIMEKEADIEALRYLKRAGFDANDAAKSLYRLAVEIRETQSKSLFLGHPATPERIRYLDREIHGTDAMLDESILEYDTNEFLLDQSLYATSISYRILQGLDRDLEKKTEVILPLLWQDVDKSLARTHGGGQAGGVMVTGVLPALADESYNIKRGDRILAVQGVPATDRYAVKRQIEGMTDVRQAVLKLQRGDSVWDERVPIIRLPYKFPVYVKGNMQDLYCGTSNRGEIFVSTPVLRFVEDRDELAFLLAHEIAHLIYKHSGPLQSRDRGKAFDLGHKLGSKLGGITGELYWNHRLDLTQAKVNLKKLPYSAKKEYTADKLALLYMKAAGFDAAAGPRLLERLLTEIWRQSPESLTFVHPVTQKRLYAAQEALTEINARLAGRDFDQKQMPTKPDDDAALGPVPGSGALVQNSAVLSLGLTDSTRNYWINRKKFQPKHRFSKDTKKIYWFAFYDGVKSFGNLFKRPSFEIAWYDPDGNLVHADTFKTSAAYPDIAKTILNIRKLDQPVPTGRWRVKVYQDEQLFDDRYFLIS